jgi:hypothetical protein
MRTMKMTVIGAGTLLMFLGAGSMASAQQVQLAIQNGRVTLVAKDATVRQILTEWARIGQTKIVNVEKIPGGPVTLELTNVSEEEALDVLLRSVSGYLTAPRPTSITSLSRYDRILVMPTSSTPPRANPATPSAIRQPLLPQPGDVESDTDQPPAVNVAAPPRGPVFSAFPQPQIANPQGAPVGGSATPPPGFVTPPQQVGGQATPPPANSAQPTSSPGGVSVPGMIVQPPRPAPQPGAQAPQR